MITLTCTKCRATLTIDDAFAGGVCRCQHCGTIQTVPKLRDRGTVAQTAQGSARTLYQGKRSAAQAPPGSGLDELGEIIASSGLSSSRLRQSSKSSDTKSDKRSKVTIPPALAGGVAAALLVLGIILWLVFGNGSQQADSRATAPGAVDSPAATPPPVVTGPNFAGLPLEGSTIIYALDRGSATAQVFDDLKEAAFRSLATLGPNRMFQIIFWDNGSVTAYPPSAPLPATPDNINAARRHLAEVYAFGQTDAQPALALAIRSKPSDLVLATAKGWDLDDIFVQMIRNVTAGSDVRIHTVAIGGKDVAGPLEAVAREFGGQFRAITAAELRAAAR